jgi:hypothetical protein
MIRNPLEPKKEWLMPTSREDHARIRIFLTTARNDEEITVSGDILEKFKYDGSHNGCYIKLDYRHAPKIYMREIKRIKRKFVKIYLTNTAQTGKELILGIGSSEECEITGEDKTSLIPDAGGFVSGRDGATIIGGFYDETGRPLLTHGQAGVAKMTRERELHTRAMPPEMLTDLLVEYNDNGTDTIAAPAAHYAIEVLGYQVHEWENSTLAISVSANLKFVTSGKYLWSGLLSASGVIKNHYTAITGIRVRGAESEALTLRNADRTGGNSGVQVVVFYHLVRIN